MIIQELLDPKMKYGDFFMEQDDLKNKYKEICKIVHPDICKDPDANKAFQKLQEFYNEALAAAGTGYWESSKQVILHTKENHTLRIPYLDKYEFELGTYYVCNKHIIYIIENRFKKYVDNMKDSLKKITFEDKKMSDYFSPRLPNMLPNYTTLDNKYVVIIEKDSDEYPLRAVVKNLTIEPAHLAWMITRLLNLTMYFNHIGLAHNGLSLDSCFINLDTHAISIKTLWYAKPLNQKMIGAPQEIFVIMSPKAKSEKISDTITDIETIKAFGRSLDKDCGKAMKQFFMSGSGDPLNELQKWDNTLAADFGTRKFVKFIYNPYDIYKKGN